MVLTTAQRRDTDNKNSKQTNKKGKQINYSVYQMVIHAWVKYKARKGLRICMCIWEMMFMMVSVLDRVAGKSLKG